MSHQLVTTSEDQESPLDRYELLRTIGHGIHAKVKLGQHLPTKTWVAIKIIGKEDSIMQQRPILEEVRCMARLRHPNIVKLFQMINTKDSLFIIMERVRGGNMQDYLLINGRMTEGKARGSFRQLVSAVHYCHERGIIHRDLKPQNVLLDPEMNVKLTDFGVSSLCKGKKLSTFCGSPAYIAPEILRKELYDGPPVDIWSLGVMLYKMVTGTVPFKGKHLIELEKSILKGTYTVPFYLTAELHTLLHKLITMDPRDRSTLEQIMPDPWLNRDHVEKLTPYIHPPSEELDPEVAQEMIDMGFKLEDIQRALTKKSYSKVKGTYLMLSTKKSAPPHRIIQVRPYQATDLSSIISSADQEAQTEKPPGPQAEQRSPGLQAEQSSPGPEQNSLGPKQSSGRPQAEQRSQGPEQSSPGPQTEQSSPGPEQSLPGPEQSSPGPEQTSPSPEQSSGRPQAQQPKEQKSGQEAEASAGPSASPDPTSAARGPSPKNKKVILQPRLKRKEVTPRHSPKSQKAILTPTRKSRTATVRTNQKSSTATPPPTQKSGSKTTTRPPVLEESTTTTIRVRPYQATDLSSIISSPDQEARTESSRRPPVPEKSTTTTNIPVRPYQATELSSIISSPDQEAQTESSRRPPVLEKSTTTNIPVRPYQATDLSSIISSPDQEARTESSRRPPVPEKSTTTNIPVRPYQATDLSSIISSPDQEAQTESSRRPPVLDESTTTNILVRPYQATDLSSIISSPDQEARTESSRRPPVPEKSTTTTNIPVRPYQATDLSSIISSPDQEARTESSRRPPVLEDSTTTTRPPKRESESNNITPPRNHTLESKKATSRPPPKFGPGDSPSTHNTSSRSGGSPEEKSQGRKGVARRCLDFLRKLCLRPFRKGLGKSNRVKPR